MIRLNVILAAIAIATTADANNFETVVPQGGDMEFAKRVVDHAEKCWAAQNDIWFGVKNAKLPDKCRVTFQLDTSNNSGGVTTYTLGSVGNPRMRVFGDQRKIFQDAIPHEVHHLVLAYNLKTDTPIPRWLDEGLCSMVESSEYLDHQEQLNLKHLREGRTPRANTLFTATEYPADVQPFYTAAVSWTRYLMNRGGFEKIVALIKGRQSGREYTDMFQELYGWKSIQQAQNDWLAWVGDGSPASKHTVSQYVYDQYGRPCSGSTCQPYPFTPSTPMPTQPMQPQPQPPVVVRPSPEPTQPTSCESCEPTQEQIAQITQTLLTAIKSDPSFKGDPGDDGDPGATRPPTEQELRDAISAYLKSNPEDLSISLELYGPNDELLDKDTAPIGGALRLEFVPVE